MAYEVKVGDRRSSDPPPIAYVTHTLQVAILVLRSYREDGLDRELRQRFLHWGGSEDGVGR